MLSPGEISIGESESKASRPESQTPSRPIGRKAAKRLSFGPHDDELRQAKLARIRAQTEAAQASAVKDRSIASDLAQLRNLVTRGLDQSSSVSDPLKELEMARAEEELLDRQLRIARKRAELQRFNQEMQELQPERAPDPGTFDQEQSTDELIRSVLDDH